MKVISAILLHPESKTDPEIDKGSSIRNAMVGSEKLRYLSSCHLGIFVVDIDRDKRADQDSNFSFLQPLRVVFLS